MSAERRVQPRRAFNSPLLIAYKGTPPYRTKALDISVGGICLILKHNVPQGTKARLAFGLHISGKHHPVMLEATSAYGVCCCDGFKTGFKFVDVPEEVIPLIHRFVNNGIALETT